MRAEIERHPLLHVLRRPQDAGALSRADWSVLLPAARRTNLLSRVACLVDAAGGIAALPDQVAFHLDSAMRIAESNARSVRWEVRKIHEALRGEGVRFALLKGAAYIVAELPPGAGRLLSDVDILVDRGALETAEKALVRHGWMPTKINPYDQRYYREWMHELPPLLHLRRGTSIDVHHTILPPTAKPHPDVARLWGNAVPVTGIDGCHVLGTAEMVLHSATHLFYEGDLRAGLRDLADIDALLRAASADDGFRASLQSAAEAHGLERPLFYALHLCRALFESPLPGEDSAGVWRTGAPSAIALAWMEGLFLRCMATGLLGPRRVPLGAPAEFAIYVRSHYLRMPLRLLVPHLLRKQFRRDDSTD